MPELKEYDLLELLEAVRDKCEEGWIEAGRLKDLVRHADEMSGKETREYVKLKEDYDGLRSLNQKLSWRSDEQHAEIKRLNENIVALQEKLSSANSALENERKKSDALCAEIENLTCLLDEHSTGDEASTDRVMFLEQANKTKGKTIIQLGKRVAESEALLATSGGYPKEKLPEECPTVEDLIAGYQQALIRERKANTELERQHSLDLVPVAALKRAVESVSGDYCEVCESFEDNGQVCGECIGGCNFTLDDIYCKEVSK